MSLISTGVVNKGLTLFVLYTEILFFNIQVYFLLLFFTSEKFQLSIVKFFVSAIPF